MAWVTIGCSLAFMLIALIAGEIWYQCKLRGPMPIIEHESTMSKQEFDDAVAAGRKLVILDDHVLDIEQFIDQHPGGRFTMSHNIGRDVSKFFYGGYSLEGNMGRKPAEGYLHSTFAKMVANNLAIARYQPEVATARTVCRIRHDLSETVNLTTKTIVFESASGKPAPNWKRSYKD